MGGFADRYVGDLAAAGQILYCLPDIGEGVGMIGHCLSQFTYVGIGRGGAILNRFGGIFDSRHGIFLDLGQLGQPFGFPEESLQILAFHFRQDSGSLHVSFVGRLHIGGPVQRGPHTGSAVKPLLSQDADLLCGLGGLAEQLLQVALERYDLVEFLANGLYQALGGFAHALSQLAGDVLELHGDLLGHLGIAIGLTQFFDQFPCLVGGYLQGPNGIRCGDFDTLGDLLRDLLHLFHFRAGVGQLLGR